MFFPLQWHRPDHFTAINALKIVNQIHSLCVHTVCVSVRQRGKIQLGHGSGNSATDLPQSPSEQQQLPVYMMGLKLQESVSAGEGKAGYSLNTLPNIPRVTKL